jgi:transposase
MNMVMRSDAAIELDDDARMELEKLLRSRRAPQAVALRARIVLMTAARLRPGVIAKALGIPQPTVRTWRLHYVEDGLPGLRNEPLPGRPRSLDGLRVADLLNQALQTRPAGQTHWTHPRTVRGSIKSSDGSH